MDRLQLAIVHVAGKCCEARREFSYRKRDRSHGRIDGCVYVQLCDPLDIRWGCSAHDFNSFACKALAEANGVDRVGAYGRTFVPWHARRDATSLTNLLHAQQ